MKAYYERNISPNRAKVEAISGEKRNHYLQNGDESEFTEVLHSLFYVNLSIHKKE